jgi:hypothetical protein
LSFSLQSPNIFRYTARVNKPPKIAIPRIQGKNFPNGFQAKSKLKSNPIPPNKSPRLLPAVGFFKKGFSFGSSYASPTGSAFASSFGKIVIENIKTPLSSPGLLG